MKCLILTGLIFISVQSFAGVDSVTINAKLKSIDGQFAKIEFQGKTYHVLKKNLKDQKSALSGSNVEVDLSADDFEFLLKH